MDKEQLKSQINEEIAKVKKALYVEEAKSALFAAIFASNLAIVFLYPFTLLTILNIFVAIYVTGFFKPTIKKQMRLQTIIKGLRDMLHKAENPPKPEKPASPWKT